MNKVLRNRCMLNKSDINIKNILLYIVILGSIIIFQKKLLTQYCTYIFLIIYSQRSLECSLKSIVYYFFLSSLNINISLPAIGILSIIRWILLFNAFFRVILYQIKHKKIKIKKYQLFFIIFIFINIISSLAFNINIKISLMKLVSYILGMYTFVYGISITKNVKWDIWLYYVFSAIILLSIGTLLFGEMGYYYRNIELFTGIISHPNIYAAFSVIALAYNFYMYKNTSIKSRKYIILLSLLIYTGTILTKARGGIIMATIILLLLFIIMIVTTKISYKKLILIVAISIIAIVMSTNNYNNIVVSIEGIIYKGNSDNIFSTRTEQISNAMNTFKDSPIIGKGFGVDENTINQNTSNLLSAPTEKGNIILAILTESGILGLIIFSLFILSFILENFNNKNKYFIIVIIAFLLTCMSEMTYFSMSNLGILNCTIMGIYIGIKNIDLCREKE